MSLDRDASRAARATYSSARATSSKVSMPPVGIHTPAQLAQQLGAAHGQRRRVVVLGELAAEPGAAPARVPAEGGLALEHERRP